MRALLGWLLLLLSCASLGADSRPVVIALPGPGALPMLPLELMPRIGADQAEGIRVTLRHFGGGPLALKDMLGGNSDFAALGLSALAETPGIRGKAYAVASMVRVPAYTLMVGARFRGKVRAVADLRGRTIGVHSASQAGKSTGQHIAEFLLRRAGVDTGEVNFVNAGQSLHSYAAALRSGAVDALVTNEPAATRLERSGTAFRLADLHHPQATHRHFGSLFQYTLLATRADVISRDADKVRRAVAALLRTLRWIQRHSPEKIAARMEIRDAGERAALVATLENNKAMFSPDGVFSDEQLQGTAALLRAISGDAPTVSGLEALIDRQWVERGP